MPDPSVIASNILQLNQRITQLASRYGRNADTIQLLAVSKTKPVADIISAYNSGLRAFGENYLQEALVKIQALEGYEIEWHFIGSIQSNKTRDIASHFHWVHSIDRLKIAQRLSQQRPSNLPPLNLCLQINASHEATKSGITMDEVTDLAVAVAGLPNIRLRGLMAIPARAESIHDQRKIFSQLHELLNTLNQQNLSLDTLSMGMSNDMEAAIAEGATIIRIGTAIFGSRTHNKT